VTVTGNAVGSVDAEFNVAPELVNASSQLGSVTVSR
jgi:hypothetical protein